MNTAKAKVTQVIRHLMSQRLLPKESEYKNVVCSKRRELKELGLGTQREENVFCSKIKQDATSDTKMVKLIHVTPNVSTYTPSSVG